MEPNCILHEERLSNIEKALETLLERDNDFYVKVINGKTEKRLASELIGELYVNMKDIKSHSFTNNFYNLSRVASAAIPILFVVAIVLMFLGYSHLANQIANLTK